MGDDDMTKDGMPAEEGTEEKPEGDTVGTPAMPDEDGEEGADETDTEKEEV